MKIGKIVFGHNKEVKRNEYINRDEFKFDYKTDLVPKRKNRLICIMFSETRGCHFILRQFNNKKENDSFRFNKGLYIIDNEGIHITSNGRRISFYLEGISTPIKMSNIEYEEVNRPYVDIYGKEHKNNLVKIIKGLKFDAKILDTFANRKFAELFTRQPIKGLEFVLLILGIVAIVMIGINYIVSYVLR